MAVAAEVDTLRFDFLRLKARASTGKCAARTDRNTISRLAGSHPAFPWRLKPTSGCLDPDLLFSHSTPQFGARAYVQLLVDTGEVGLDRFRANQHRGSDLPVRLSGRRQLCDPVF